MDRKVFSVLFVIIATVVNVIIAITLFTILLALASFILTPETNSSIKLIVQLFVVGGALFGSLAIYNLVFKKIGTKLLNKYAKKEEDK